MTSQTTHYERDEQAVAELAETFHEREMALQVATSAGFPVAMLPDFSTPLTFWGRVVEQAARGALPGGPTSLLEAASRLYPHNQSLRARLTDLPPSSSLAPARRRFSTRAVALWLLAVLGLGLIATLGGLSWAGLDEPSSELLPEPVGVVSPDRSIPVDPPDIPGQRSIIQFPERPSIKGVRDPASGKLIEELLPAGCWSEKHGFISGRVRDDQGHPLADAMVCAWSHDPRAPVDLLRSPACTYTDARGDYRVSVAPSIYDVVASAPAHRPQSSRTRDGYPVPIETRQVRKGFDFQLDPGGMEIHGTVQTTDDQPLAGALVAPLGTPQTVAIVESDGTFDLWVDEGQGLEELGVVAWAIGYTDQALPAVADVPLCFVLERESALLGVVVDAEGTSVPNAKVGSGTKNGLPGSIVRTDANGEFVFFGLPTGKYHPWARTADADGRAKPVEVRTGKVSPKVFIELRPKEPSPPPPPPTNPCEDTRRVSDSKARRCLKQRIRKCSRGRRGTIEVSAPFIVNDGTLLSPTVSVTGDAAMHPTVHACALERTKSARFHPRRSPTAFQSLEVTR